MHRLVAVKAASEALLHHPSMFEYPPIVADAIGAYPHVSLARDVASSHSSKSARLAGYTTSRPSKRVAVSLEAVMMPPAITAAVGRGRVAVFDGARRPAP